jgi:hypothetical protein
MCLWINELTDRSVTTNVGNGEDDEGAATRSTVSMMGLLTALSLGLSQLM